MFVFEFNPISTRSKASFTHNCWTWKESFWSVQMKQLSVWVHLKYKHNLIKYYLLISECLKIFSLLLDPALFIVDGTQNGQALSTSSSPKGLNNNINKTLDWCNRHFGVVVSPLYCRPQLLAWTLIPSFIVALSTTLHYETEYFCISNLEMCWFALNSRVRVKVVHGLL